MTAPHRLIAARPAPGRPLPPEEVLLPRRLLAAPPGDGPQLVRVVSRSGREVVAPARPDDAGEAAPAGGGVLRVGRLLWTALGARPGDALEVTPVTLPCARTVTLVPAHELSPAVRDGLPDAARRRALPAWPGALHHYRPVDGAPGTTVLVRDCGDERPARIGPDTQVHVAAADPAVRQAPVGLADVGGLEETIRRLRQLLFLPLQRPDVPRALGIQPPRGVLLHGPPGTGKTLLCRAVAEEIGATVISTAATELVGSFSGETEANLRELFARARKGAPCLIVIDEIDVLCADRGQLSSQSDIRAASQLLSLMDGLEEAEGVAVLGTTNRVEAIDPAFRRPGRFDQEIAVEPPARATRAEILAIHTRDMPLTPPAEAALDHALAHGLLGFTGADLMSLAREIGLAALERISSGDQEKASAPPQSLAIEAEDVVAGLRRVQASALRGLAQPAPAVAWAESAAPDAVKRRLAELGAAALAGDGGQGALVSGPPGSGKTTLVRALASELEASVVQIDGAGVFTQWLGQSEAALRARFDKARAVAPTVLLVEHLDAMAPRRHDGGGDQAASRVLAAFLSAVDEAVASAGVFVVGVTDRPDLVDPAVTRPGRLGAHLEVPSVTTHRRAEGAQRRRGES